MSTVYVYALIELPARQAQSDGKHSGAITVRGHRIRLIPIGTMHAAVEPLDSAPVLSEKSLREQHDVVVALAHRFDAVLPARFGAAVDTAELERLVTLRRTALKRAFDTVRGCEQMTVRIFGPALVASIGSADRPETGTGYLRRRRAARLGSDLDFLNPTARTTIWRGQAPPGRSGAHMRSDNRDPTPGRIRQAVKPVIERERVDSGRGRVRATLHHLIRRGRAEEYRLLVTRSLGDLPPHHDVVVSGPWPAFAFTPDLWP